MTSTLMLTGDICLMGVDDPNVPFRKMPDTFGSATVLFGNLECCLYDLPEPRESMPDTPLRYEGLYAPSAAASALKLAGFHGLGNANNETYGAEAIMASNALLDELCIGHTGTGANKAAARSPLFIERNGTRFGFIQRTSQYWPNNHEAGERTPGVAVMRAYTAYLPPYYKDGPIAPNRPGMPAKIVTWTDPDYLSELKQDVSAMKQQCDIAVASHHWGYTDEILDYQSELAHAAIDAGADIVMGHGPHHSLAMEIYKDKPIFYGLSTCYFVRSRKRRLDDYVGMIARITVENGEMSAVAYSLVRKNAEGEAYLCSIRDEQEEVDRIERMSAPYATKMERKADQVMVWKRRA